MADHAEPIFLVRKEGKFLEARLDEGCFLQSTEKEVLSLFHFGSELHIIPFAYGRDSGLKDSLLSRREYYDSALEKGRQRGARYLYLEAPQEMQMARTSQWISSVGVLTLYV